MLGVVEDDLAAVHC